MGPDKVPQLVSAEKTPLDRKGVDTSFTENIRCKDAPEAVKKRPNEEVREPRRRRANRFILPMCGEPMLWIYEEVWAKSD